MRLIRHRSCHKTCGLGWPVEAGHPDTWFKYVGLDGAVVGIDRFGLSAPGAQAPEAMGMTTDRVVAQALAVLGRA